MKAGASDRAVGKLFIALGTLGVIGAGGFAASVMETMWLFRPYDSLWTPILKEDETMARQQLLQATWKMRQQRLIAFSILCGLFAPVAAFGWFAWWKALLLVQARLRALRTLMSRLAPFAALLAITAAWIAFRAGQVEFRARSSAHGRSILARAGYAESELDRHIWLETFITGALSALPFAGLAAVATVIAWRSLRGSRATSLGRPPIALGDAPTLSSSP